MCVRIDAECGEVFEGLCTTHKTTFTRDNLRWREDEFGWYWVADLLDERGKKIGVTGNYYELDERLDRPAGFLKAAVGQEGGFRG